MVRSTGNRVRASHGGATTRADTRHVTAINGRFTAVLATIVAVCGRTSSALAVQAVTVCSDFANLVDDTSWAGTPAIDVRFRSVLLTVKALRVTAFILGARDIADAITRLIAGLTLVANRTLCSPTVNVGLRIIKFAVLAGSDIADATDTHVAGAAIRILKTLLAHITGRTVSAAAVSIGFISVENTVVTGCSATHIADTGVALAAIGA